MSRVVPDPAAEPSRAIALADIHSHLVPGVDDGARDRAEALEAIDRLVAAGVNLVVTTPHLDVHLVGRRELFERFQKTVEAAWSTVVEACRKRHPDLELHLGREVMLTVAEPDLDDPRVRLNGGGYVLVEFPRLTVPPDSEELLRHVRAGGYVPVLAHVERYHYRDLDVEQTLESWRALGAVLQVNAPSLAGAHGHDARALAWEILRRGWAGVLASDYHARGKTWLDIVRDELIRRGGRDQIRRLYDVNPRRIAADQPVEAVPPLPTAAEGPDGPGFRIRSGRRGP
jgi:protein-tyrosine phosphatase